MKKLLVFIAVFLVQPRIYSQYLTEYPPYLPEKFGDIPLNSGRCHSITTNPRNRNIIITSNQNGGLWKTTDAAATWYHLNGLNTVVTNDVCFGPNGNAVICTRGKDNNVDNGGGIWASRDGGETWGRPSTGRIPVFPGRTPARGAAFGISYDPDSTVKIFVGTTSGIAISSNNGFTWRHAMLESSSGVWGDSLQNAVYSVLAYGQNKVFALTRTGVYKSDDGGISWRNIRSGNFTFYGSFKQIDKWDNTGVTEGGKGVFILQNYSTLLLYEDFYNRWTTVPFPACRSRGPFVRVSNSATPGYKSVWIGGGVEMFKITMRRLSSFAPGLVSASDWVHLHRPEGIHDDSGFMGLDGSGNIILYGSDGGLFRPLNTAGTRWTNACVSYSGMNSYQITDMGITNYRGSFFGITLPEITALYFSTQDNGIWASADEGAYWPNNDCAEGFHIEVKRNSNLFEETVQVAYGKVGCAPSSCMFSGPVLVGQRMVPTISTTGVDLGDSILAQAFLIGNYSYYRMRFPVGGNPEGYVSNSNGSSWRKRYEYSGVSPRGVPNCGTDGPGGPNRIWIPFTTNGLRNADGSDKIGLMLHFYPFNTGTATMNSGVIKYLPNNGSLGLRATEFDWQAVFAVDPNDYSHLIVPDIVNNVVKVTRDGGFTWVTDNVLTNLVTRGGTLKLYDGTPYIEISHISWDPYHSNRILVGTRESGIILSEDGGTTWRRIAGSYNVLFATGFVFRPDNICFVSTYGRGIWKIDFNVFVASPDEYYICRSCIIYDNSFVQTNINNYSSYAVVSVRGGQVTGLSYGKDQQPQLHISEKAFYKAWIPENSNEKLPAIIRSKKAPNDYLDKLRSICNNCAVTGVLMKGNTVTGYITHPNELPLEKEDQGDFFDPNKQDIMETNMPEEGSRIPDNQPQLSIECGRYINGFAVLGKDSKLVLRVSNLKGLQLITGTIRLDGEVIMKPDIRKWKQDQNGSSLILDLPQDIGFGLHQLSYTTISQKNMSTSFLVVNQDEFEKNNSANRPLAPEKDIIKD